MIGALLMYVLGDVVFDAAKSTGRLYEREFTQYLEERGFVKRPDDKVRPAS